MCDDTGGSLLHAGFGAADITPPVGTPLMGYRVGAARDADAVRDRLRAGVLRLGQAGQRAAIVGLDLCLIDREVDAMRTWRSAGVDDVLVEACAARLGELYRARDAACEHQLDGV